MSKSVANPLVSVVIITRDREKGLQQCIKSIVNNNYKNIELVILDNGSSMSRKRNRKFSSSLEFNGKIEYVESSPRGFAELRQMAVESSHGEIIMYIDDDSIADKDSISEIVRCFMSDEKVGIVGGNITNIGFKGENKFKGRGKIGINGKYQVVQDPRDAEVFGSTNMSIRREAFDKVGGYDLFFSGGLEEADLTLLIRKERYRVVYEPNVKISHFYTPASFRIKRRNMEIHRLYLFFKHYMPDDVTDWVRFFSRELRLLVEDIKRIIHERILTKILRKRNAQAHTDVIQNKRRVDYLSAFLDILVGFYKIIIARLIIPYLIYKASRIRRS